MTIFRRRTAAPVPFRPYNAHELTQDQAREALRGHGQNLPVAAMIQLLEAQIGVAISEMADGKPGACGAYRMLREYYEGLIALLDATK